MCYVGAKKVLKILKEFQEVVLVLGHFNPENNLFRSCGKRRWLQNQEVVFAAIRTTDVQVSHKS